MEENKLDRANKIELLKENLYNTDYIVIKAMEGQDVREYGDYKTMRQHIRDEINLIESLSEGQYDELYPIVDELGDAKRTKLMEINVYDQSDNVNQFMLGDIPMWLDAPTRQTLRISIETYQATGAETVTKWFEGQLFTFPTSAWIQMLNALEVYAAEALNATEAHKAAIMNMDNIEDVQEYDITDGYPEKLDLSVEFLTKLA